MKVKVAQSCLILCDPTDYTVHGILQARIFSLLQVIEPSFPPLQVNSLPAEPQGKPKNTGVSLSLLQWIFLTQELNWDLLHCRQILYQLSYQGSPGEGNGNPHQYSCLENSMDREAWGYNPWGGKESDTTE